MKITGYTQQVTNVSGSGSAPTLNASVQAKAAASDVVDMSPVAKGLGDWAKRIEEERQQKDTQAAFNAINEYNNQVYNALYNEQNGLMNLQGSEASDVSNLYAKQEKEIRDNILGKTKFYNKANQIAVMNNFEKLNLGNMEAVGKWQHKQNEVAKVTTYNNNMQSSLALVAKNFNNPEYVIMQANNLAIMAGDNARWKGVEAQRAAAQKARGDIFGAAMEMALAAGDTPSFNRLKNIGSGFLSPEQMLRMEKISYKKQQDDYNYSVAREAFSMFPDDPVKAREYIQNKGGFVDGAGDSSLVDSVRRLQGKIGYRASDGTNCMRTMGIALKNTPYAGQINVDQAIATARENNQLMSAENYIPKAGDLAVVNNGNHIVMVTESGGTIQNGESHDGVWESDTSAKDMFGGVKYYIRTSDYSSTSKGVNHPMDREQVDKAMQYYNQNASQARAEKVIAEKALFTNVSEQVRQMCESKASEADFMAYIEKVGGNDLEKREKVQNIVHRWGNIYGANFTSGGIGSSSSKGSNKNYVDEGRIDTMLAQGKFPTQETLLNVLDELNANPAQVSKALKQWDNWFQRKGMFNVDFDAVKSNVFGHSNLSPAEEAQWRSIQDIIKRETSKMNVKESRDLYFSEMVDIGIDAIKKRPYSFGVWSNDETTRADAMKGGFLDFEGNANGVWVTEMNGAQHLMDKEVFERRIKGNRS